MSNKPLISVITATYNAAAYLPKLIESLKSQTSKDFEWVIADGASTDETLEIIENIDGINLKISSQDDFGIYDAINRAINLASGEYYVVIGADDYFFDDAIENILNLLKDDKLDFIVGQVETECGLIKIHFGKSFIYGARAFVASHSVGCVIKKDLHAKLGFYTNKYPILADTYFIKKVFMTKNLNIKYTSKTFGHFSIFGVSKTNGLRTQCEFGHIQMTSEKYKYLQAIIFFMRIVKELIKFK